MEIIEFNKILSKSLEIVNVGIKKGYFDANKKDELNNKLLSIFKNGIVYDLPGTAVFGMYSPSEKKLYFNAKVFKSEDEALVYILHEIKHGLDHYDELLGFKYKNQGVGINEGATQRFATDMTEEILQIEIPKKVQTSLGIQLNTNLDEYQIEDKLNYLFCITMGISIEEFIRMQNDEKKEDLKKLIDKFNQYANFETFKKSLDEIYMIQEETWIDENGNLLDKEKPSTINQTKRAMELISCCKQELFKYAKKENQSIIDKLKEESFMTMNEYGEIFRDNYGDEETNNQNNSYKNDIMTERAIVEQADYINYQQDILNQIGSATLSNDCNIIFVTEFRYEHENCDKIIYFRKGESYQKMIIPMQDDMKLNIANINVQKVDDINEIKNSIEECETEFGVIADAFEYAKILNMCGESTKAQNVLNKWKYFLSKQNELEQIRHNVCTTDKILTDEMERLRNLLINGEELETQQSSEDSENGTISLNKTQLDLLDSNNGKAHK